ncbi:ABC transporter substrate-binding protein [Polymorphobacter multimanifer]|uniref:Multiple sugar transport system substrate-binding protein n=1 Tax=Polymorphobacter multimanifer TaxID=1070431 RepID=A0A841L7T4_9SPHN|nr:ABC transporter substrate-binding protein [Polymorphobacter multimanifer]MBB6228266.1 multiple sugar transport system substrate-binding protein [Polymorphobacter multimanifer]GGI92434.1 ABC transporter substrate-binding protein [Polymorphobacter multimanifer]
MTGKPALSDTSSLCDRRSVLAAALALPVAACGAPDDRKLLRWWSPQAAPAQARAYKAQIKRFEAANPGYRVAFEQTSDDGYPAQFAAAFAAGQVPNIVTHLPSFAAQSYYAQGLVEPMDAVVASIGADRFLPGANAPYLATDGRLSAVALGGTAVDMLWLRRDLMEAAGLAAPPRDWDELRDACRRMQTARIYGAPLPFGTNSMTSLVFISFIHRAGGQVFAPDLTLTLDSPATYAALDFYRSMREFCPPSASSFGWADSLNAFVSGATATGIYGGRVLVNVARQNPAMARQLLCVPYPGQTAATPAWTFNDFPCLFIPKGASEMAATRALAVSLYEPEGYIGQMLAAPGHVLPVLRGITNSPDYSGNPITTMFAKEIATMTAAAAAGHNLGFESAAHAPNVKAGEIIASNAIAEMVQRVTISGEPAKAAVARATDRIAAIMRAGTDRG